MSKDGNYAMCPPHPARFNDRILEAADQLLGPRLGWILDPFAGTGRVHELRRSGRFTIGVEIEPEWAAMHPRTIVGSALALPFGAETFDAIVTSPTYGNRMADHRAQSADRSREPHCGREGSIRSAHCAEQSLAPDRRQPSFVPRCGFRRQVKRGVMFIARAKY